MCSAPLRPPPIQPPEMSVPKPDLHIRISEQAKARLMVLAEYDGKAQSELAGEHLEEWIHGRYHTLMIALKKARRLGLTGIERDEE